MNIIDIHQINERIVPINETTIETNPKIITPIVTLYIVVDLFYIN